MKTIGTIIISLFITLNFALAQDTLYIYKAGAVLYQQVVSNIDSVTFKKSNANNIPDNSPDEIVGKWQVTATYRHEYGKPDTTTEEMTGVIFEFNANLSYSSIYQHRVADTGTYFINGSVISLKSTEADEYSTSTFSISDNTLHLFYVGDFDYGEEPIVCEIVASRIN
jgi:hypothetical protein